MASLTATTNRKRRRRSPPPSDEDRCCWKLLLLGNGSSHDDDDAPKKIPQLLFSKNQVVGRSQLLECRQRACCGASHHKTTCRSCQSVIAWASKYLSSQLFRVLEGNRLQVRGSNAVGQELVLINDEPVFLNSLSDSKGWSLTTVKIEVGTKITFQQPKDRRLPTMEFQVVECLPTKSPTTTTASTCVSPPTKRQATIRDEDPDTTIELPSSGNLETTWTPFTPPRESQDPEATDTPTLMQRLQNQIERDCQTMRNENEDEQPRDCETTAANIAPAPPTKLPAAVAAPTTQAIDIVDLCGIDERDRTTVGRPAEPIDLVSSQEASQASVPFSPTLYFVRRGMSLTKVRIEILTKKMHNKGLAQVVSSSQEALTHATHWIVDPHLTKAELANCMGFRKASALEVALDKKDIQVVKPVWIEKADTALLEPRIDESLTYKFRPSIRASKRARIAELVEEDTVTKRADSKLSTSDCTGAATAANAEPWRPRNVKLSELFQKLSQLHAEAPLKNEDEWKAYTYNRVAGRVRHLDFDIVNEPGMKQKVRSIKGFGEATWEKIEEYLEMGTFRRFKAFEQDPERVAMKAMMKIWGVGPSKASELVNSGFRTIEDVRQGLASGKLHLTANQKIGVECYEVFEEKMTRAEVEIIYEIVRKAVVERFPNAQVQIMGSYRRGKTMCGDIDLLIVDPAYIATTPRGALSELVDTLRKRGHMSHHLTHLKDMKTPSHSADEASQQSSLHSWLKSPTGSTRPPPPQQEDPKSVSYMGVFHSPTVPGKRRRIDIKFYPYRERIFASLYFTGNGWFNRSMRLFATQIKKLSLGDHGFHAIRQDKKRSSYHSSPDPNEKMEVDADSEKDVFDFLGLVYKEPHERDCFDAVIPKDPSVFEQLDHEPDRALFRQETNHKWIH